MHNHFFWTTFGILIVFVSSGYVWLLKCRFLQTQTVSRVPWWFHTLISHPKHRNSTLPLATVLIQTHIYKHNAASHAASINPRFLYGKGRVCKTCRNGPTDLFNFSAGSSGHGETYFFLQLDIVCGWPDPTDLGKCAHLAIYYIYNIKNTYILEQWNCEFVWKLQNCNLGFS